MRSSVSPHDNKMVRKSWAGCRRCCELVMSDKKMGAQSRLNTLNLKLYAIISIAKGSSCLEVPRPCYSACTRGQDFNIVSSAAKMGIVTIAPVRFHSISL